MVACSCTSHVLLFSSMSAADGQRDGCPVSAVFIVMAGLVVGSLSCQVSDGVD